MSGLTNAPDFSVAPPPAADLRGIEVDSTSSAEPPATAEGVYEIGGEDASGYEQALRDAQAPGALAPKPTPFPTTPAADRKSVV